MFIIILFYLIIVQVSSNVFLSLHTVGTSYKHWVNFNQQEDMREVLMLMLDL